MPTGLIPWKQAIPQRAKPTAIPVLPKKHLFQPSGTMESPVDPVHASSRKMGEELIHTHVTEAQEGIGWRSWEGAIESWEGESRLSVA